MRLRSFSRFSVFALLTLSLTGAACAGQEDGLEDLAYRAQDELSIFEPTNSASDGADYLIWTIVDEDVHSAPTAGGDLLVSFKGSRVVDADGTTLCTFNSRNTVLLHATTGQVLLTLSGNNIYEGNKDGQAEYLLQGNEVTDSNSNPLFVASSSLTGLSKKTKLMVAAMTDGVCDGQ